MNKVEITKDVGLSYEGEKLVILGGLRINGELYDIVVEQERNDLSKNKNPLDDLAQRVQNVALENLAKLSPPMASQPSFTYDPVSKQQKGSSMAYLFQQIIARKIVISTRPSSGVI